LQLGHQALGLLFTLVGPGDVGEVVVLPDGRQVRRLEAPHSRVYQSVFGRFEVGRVVYGSREGQKIEYVPFDTQLQLPESDFSYLLQDWTQSLAVENTFYVAAVVKPSGIFFSAFSGSVSPRPGLAGGFLGTQTSRLHDPLTRADSDTVNTKCSRDERDNLSLMMGQCERSPPVLDA